MRNLLLTTTAFLLLGVANNALAQSSACTAAVPNFSASVGGFGVINGQIYSPGGTPFIARGINIRSTELGDVLSGAVTAAFPKLNFVRINIRNLDDPASLASAVNYLTSRGIVAELEDHPNGGGGQGSIGALSGDTSWYGQAAGYFKNNPYVWFGTYNEPPTDGSLSAWHKATYDAIRGTGNQNPILIEPGGSRPWNLTSALDPSVYTTMTNIIMDPHAYDYQSNYSTDQGTVNASVQAMISAAQSIKSADGTVPVIIAEYGNSTDGSTTDAGGDQEVKAVINSGVGSAAWSWVSYGSDALRNGDGSLTDYGRDVRDFIQGSGAQGCAESPIATPDLSQTTPASSVSPPVPAVAATATATADMLTPGSAPLTDAAGNNWVITATGSIMENGQYVPGGGGTSALTVINGVVYGRDNGHDGNTVNSGGWFRLSADGQSWAPSATPPAPNTAPETAPPLATASTAQTAPPLTMNSLSVAEVAAKAAAGNP